MAHLFDTAIQIPSTPTSTSTAHPLTSNFTCGSGATVLVVMLIYAGAVDRAGGAPTYNGIALTQVDVPRRGVTSPECTAEMWYLLDPSIGTFSVSIPNTGGLAMKAFVASAKSDTDASFLHGSVGAGTTGINPTASGTTTRDGCVIFAVVANGATTWAPSARAGVQIADVDLGTWGGGAQYLLQATAGTQAMSWTFATSEDYGLVVGAFKPIAAVTQIYMDKLNTKLGAILAKDRDDIVAKNVYLPFIGQGYTKATLENWLAARSDLLVLAQTSTPTQIKTRITNYYQSLGAADKVIADKILDGEQYDLGLASDFNAYEKLVAIVLSCFITRS
jgi:hypothetical protein